MKFTSILFTFIILFSACNSNHESSFKSSKPSMSDKSDEGLSYDEEQESIQIDRKLITEGNISFETNNVDTSRSQILAAVKKYNGYVSSDQAYNSEYSISNNLIIRIPSDKLLDFMYTATQGVSKFDNKSIDTKDVTEDYQDLSTRIKNKKELEKRFVKLLDKAYKVSEILEIEREVARLRTDIETKEGKLKYLDNRISYSTINFNFYQKVSEKLKYSSKFSEGFIKGWKNLLHFLVGTVNLWPFILMFIGLTIGLRFRLKKRKSKLAMATE